MAHTDLELIGYFEQGMDIAQLAEPGNQIGVEMLMALGADIDGFAETEGVHCHRRFARVEILRIGGEDLAVLGLDNIAPQPRWMKMSRRESAFECQMVFFPGWK